MEQAARVDRETLPDDGRLDLIEFLDGRVHAWGVFEDRTGRLRRRFEADLTGSGEGDLLSVDERLVFDDGAVERRLWQFERKHDGRFVATGTDIVGRIEGRCEGASARMSYRLRMLFRRHAVEVDFDDRYYRVGADRLINRATVSKFGLRIGEVTIVFERLADGDDATAARLNSPTRAAA